MPRPKGLPRTGGRKKGTPNKLTQSVIDRLSELGVDPIQGMATIAADEAAPIEIRARMFAELAQYIAPKRRAIDHDLMPATAAAMGPRVINVVAFDPSSGPAAPTYRPDGLPPPDAVSK